MNITREVWADLWYTVFVRRYRLLQTELHSGNSMPNWLDHEQMHSKMENVLSELLDSALSRRGPRQKGRSQVTLF